MAMLSPGSLSQGQMYIYDAKMADVNGDRINDIVYLVGSQPSGDGSPFVENITVLVQDGNTGNFYSIPLETNVGYQPFLFLGDFTGDGVADIYVRITSGGSGGYGYFYIYSFLANVPREMFNYDRYNEENRYSVRFQDNYKVEVISLTLQKKYIIDLSTKDPSYLAEIYDANGQLLKPIEGSVLGLEELFYVDVEGDNIYELLAVQRIIGQYNADTLGYIQTFLRWDGLMFKPYNQWLAIL